LSEQSNSRVRAFNAGVSGNHSMHSVLNLIGKGIELEPDYAVLMHNINDLAVLTKTGSYWIAPHSRSIIQTENLEGEFNLIVIVRALKNYFLPHLYSYLKPRLFPSSGAVADEFEQIGLSWKEINRTGIQEQFKDSLVSFVLLCRVWDIEPILMTQFNRINKDDPAFQFWFEKIKDRGLKEDEFISEYNGFNDIIRQVASEHNVLLIDLAKLVPSTSTYLYDVVHLTEEGSKLVGEIFVDAFLKR